MNRVERRTTPKVSVESVRIPVSLQPTIEATLDSWQEREGDDERCIIKNELPYSRVPAKGAARLVDAVAKTIGSEAVTQRLEALRPALVDLLRKTSIDDLDSVAMLEWLVEHGCFELVGDRSKSKAKPKPQGPAVPYTPECAFAVGDRVAHPKFGEGEVLRRLDGKVEIGFASGVRTLQSK